MRKLSFIVIVCALLVLCGSRGYGEVVAGRDIYDKGDLSIKFSLGSVSDMEGAVQETTRKYYDATDQQFKQDTAENYSLNDFGMEDGYATLGFQLENIGKYFTFQLEGSFMNPEVDAVARRNYYIGVGENIDYGGGSYENLKIEEGTSFSMDLIGGSMEIRGLLTPFTLRFSDAVRFTPWLDFGLYTFLGYYEIDAGLPHGVTQYLEPPEDFVVGGTSEGFVGVGTPELGVGGEIRFGGDESANLVIQGYYTGMQLEGDTSFFTSSQHREKDIELDHSNIKTKVALELPMGGDNRFTFGFQYQLV